MEDGCLFISIRGFFLFLIVRIFFRDKIDWVVVFFVFFCFKLLILNGIGRDYFFFVVFVNMLSIVVRGVLINWFLLKDYFEYF